MALLIGVLWILVYVAILALVIYIILWGVTAITGVAIPAKIVQLIWLVVALVCLIWIVTLLAGSSPPWPVRIH